MYRSIGIWVHRLIDTKQWPFASAFAQNSHSALFLCLTLIDQETATLLFFLCLFLLILELELNSLKTQSLCSPWIGVPWWLLSHQGFGDTMLCFLACDCWLFWTPAQLPYEQTQLTCWKKRDHVEEEAFRHRWSRTSQLPGNLLPEDAGTNSVVTTQLSLAQLSDH